ncbi:MAG TPA: hypothetical protein VNG33_15645 [Polyangiaceae bacterium]|nr:hypothetical protein [Polyangiaceae bacterium]
MSTQEQITKLQGLLDRVKKNAAAPRASAPQVAAPVARQTAPVPAAAPPIAAPPAFAAPAPSYADGSVDDLLAASPEPSPTPLEIDVPLESVPPVAEIPGAPSHAPPSEPFALASSGHAAPPPVEASTDLDEVSEVRVTTAMREPAVEVTVAAIAAEAEPIGTEELSDDDLVEVTEGTPPPGDVDIDFDDEDEQPPVSSKRVASSMDEALAAAAEQAEAEREVPIKTPPPESGPQAAPLPTGLTAPHAPDVDALLGGELDIPTRGETAAAAGPTTEQLGQTIDLEEARGPSLELAEHRIATPAPARVEELEVALPPRDVALGYDESLQPPPEARQELDAHRRRTEDDIAPPPEPLAQVPSVEAGQAPAMVPFDAAAAGPEVIARPAPAGTPEAFGLVRDSFRPNSFVELLDASLALEAQ